MLIIIQIQRNLYEKRMLLRRDYLTYVILTKVCYIVFRLGKMCKKSFSFNFQITCTLHK